MLFGLSECVVLIFEKSRMRLVRRRLSLTRSRRSRLSFEGSRDRVFVGVSFFVLDAC